jgi:hypothetical protein
MSEGDATDGTDANYQTNPCARIENHKTLRAQREPKGRDWWFFAKRTQFGLRALCVFAVQITKRSQALGALVQGFGFKGSKL